MRKIPLESSLCLALPRSQLLRIVGGSRRILREIAALNEVVSAVRCRVWVGTGTRSLRVAQKKEWRLKLKV